MLSNTPDTLRLVVVDLDCAFRELRDNPWLWHENALRQISRRPALEELDFLIEEMEQRQRDFQSAAAEDVQSWRARTGMTMPRIVCVFDEFADFMTGTATRRTFEDRVVRLGEGGGAVGIHLVLATRRLEQSVLSPRIQACLDARLCFRTATTQASSMALRAPGAERLLGNGDALYTNGGKLWRLQAPLLTEQEREGLFTVGAVYEGVNDLR